MKALQSRYRGVTGRYKPSAAGAGTSIEARDETRIARIDTNKPQLLTAESSARLGRAENSQIAK
jgi:hypothetical protein